MQQFYNSFNNHDAFNGYLNQCFKLLIVLLSLLISISKSSAQIIESEVKLTPGYGTNEFGYDVDISGNFAIVGQMSEESSDEQSSVSIYQFDGTQWNETRITDTNNNISFGVSVAIDGTRAVIGSIQSKDQYDRQNVVFDIYEYEETEWSLKGSILLANMDIPTINSEYDSYLPTIMDLSGDRIIVGQQTWSRAFIYKYNGNNWLLEKTLDPRGGVKDFGNAVAIDNNTVVIGDRSSLTYVYQHDGTTWVATQQLEGFGGHSRVDVSGNKIVISEIDNFYTYQKGYDGKWELTQRIFSRDIPIIRHVKMWQNYLAIGGEMYENGQRSGGLLLYKFKNDRWNEIQLISPIAIDSAKISFGYSVGITDSRIIAGASRLNEAYIYEFEASEQLIKKIEAGTQSDCDPLTNTYSQEVIITYTDAPSSGTLIVNGVSFPITNSPQTVTLENLVSNQRKIDVYATFSDNAEAYSYASSLFQAPYPCDPILATQVKLDPKDSDFIGDFGYEVAISGNYAIVGGSHISPKRGTGDIHIFEKKNDNWNSTVFSNPYETDWRFGTCVDIDGNRAVATTMTRESTLKAYIYEKEESGWILKDAVETTPGAYTAEDDLYRNYVSLSGNRLAIGAQLDNIGNGDVGSVFIFEYDGNRWLQTAKLVASDREVSSYFGSFVSVDDDLMVIGTNRKAYIYEYDGKKWIEKKIISVPNDNLTSVKVKDGIIGVTTNTYQQLSENEELAFVYEKIQGDWSQVAKLVKSNGALGRYSVTDISIEGETIIIGSESDGGGTGVAYIFNRKNGVWQETKKIFQTGNQFTSKYFGQSVDISNGRVIIGCKNSDIAGIGSAFIYDLQNSTSNSEIIAVKAGDQSACDPVTNTYSQKVTVTYENAPATGVILINDKPFAIKGSPQTILIKNLPSDGKEVDVTATFSDAPETQLTEIALFKAPASCVVGVYETKILASDGSAEDGFGYAVAISGVTAVVGAYHDKDFGYDSGSAYIFYQEGSDWIEKHKLVASDASSVDRFGIALGMNQNYIIAGAPLNDDHGDDSGSAYIFKKDSQGKWNEIKKLTASDASSKDRLGYSVFISDNYAAVGAPYGDGRYTNSGALYIYTKSSDQWLEQAKLVPDDARTGDKFGWSVAVDGHRIVAASSHDDDNGTDSGSIYVFDLDGSTWKQTAKLKPTDGKNGDRFGICVALDGDRIVAGANLKDSDDAGAAYVFELKSGKWQQTAKLTAFDAQPKDRFGTSVSLSGDKVVVGAPYADHEGGTNAGAAYVYAYNNGSWELDRKVIGDAHTGDYLGRSVAVHGNNLIAGAHNDDDKGSNAGSAYLFDLLQTPTNSLARVQNSDLKKKLEEYAENEADETTTNALVFPNPFSNEFTVNLPASVQGEVRVELMDQMGKVVYVSQQQVQAGQQGLAINMESVQAKGLLFVRVIAESQPVQLGKLVRQ